MTEIEVIKKMQEGMEKETNPLYLTYTGWYLERKKIYYKIAQSLEDKGLIQFIEVVRSGGGEAHKYFLTQKGKIANGQ